MAINHPGIHRVTARVLRESRVGTSDSTILRAKFATPPARLRPFYLSVTLLTVTFNGVSASPVLRKDWGRKNRTGVTEVGDSGLARDDKTPPRRVGVTLKPRLAVVGSLFFLPLPPSPPPPGQRKRLGGFSPVSPSSLTRPTAPSSIQSVELKTTTVIRGSLRTVPFFRSLSLRNAVNSRARALARCRLLFICGVFQLPPPLPLYVPAAVHLANRLLRRRCDRFT